MIHFCKNQSCSLSQIIPLGSMREQFQEILQTILEDDVQEKTACEFIEEISTLVETHAIPIQYEFDYSNEPPKVLPLDNEFFTNLCGLQPTSVVKEDERGKRSLFSDEYHHHSSNRIGAKSEFDQQTEKGLDTFIKTFNNQPKIVTVTKEMKKKEVDKMPRPIDNPFTNRSDKKDIAKVSEDILNFENSLKKYSNGLESNKDLLGISANIFKTTIQQCTCI